MMAKLLRRVAFLVVALAVLLACEACKKDAGTGPTAGANPTGTEGPATNKHGDGDSKPTSTRQAMMRIGKGQKPLSPTIGAELQTDPPPWDAIQQETRELSELAAGLRKQKAPPKGTPESWEKLTTAFADAAVALDKAAQGKNKDEALAAHETISKSCKECHNAHRGKAQPGG
jgi:hypothetical protein